VIWSSCYWPSSPRRRIGVWALLRALEREHVERPSVDARSGVMSVWT
jgi:hypothetical protein